MTIKPSIGDLWYNKLHHIHLLVMDVQNHPLDSTRYKCLTIEESTERYWRFDMPSMWEFIA